MPIYEYACRECGHEFETLVRSDTVPECPRCHATALDKRLSVFAPAVAGGGAASASPAPLTPCGACGHPAGPGACSFG